MLFAKANQGFSINCSLRTEDFRQPIFSKVVRNSFVVGKSSSANSGDIAAKIDVWHAATCSVWSFPAQASPFWADGRGSLARETLRRLLLSHTVWPQATGTGSEASSSPCLLPCPISDLVSSHRSGSVSFLQFPFRTQHNMQAKYGQRGCASSSRNYQSPFPTLLLHSSQVATELSCRGHAFLWG